MHLIQILLPLTDNHHRPLERGLFAAIKQELTAKFGGITAWSSAPAEGRWKNEEQEQQDQIILYEVMVDAPDAEWWKAYRHRLEAHFRQEEIIIRALPMQLL